MQGLAFNLLGQFQATDVRGRHLEFPTNKAQALLAYLLVEESNKRSVNHKRESLMMLFWPDILLESAQANLRQTLYRLRKSLPDIEIKANYFEPLIISDRRHVSINPRVSYYLDVADFEQGIRSGKKGASDERIASLAEVVTLYRGDFLENVTIPDSQEFDKWAEQIRQQLRRDVLAALHHIGQHAIDHGAYDRAEEVARRQIAIDDYHEAGYQQLMIALAAKGQRTDALTEFNRLLHVLANDLRVEPSRETTMLAEVIGREQYDRESIYLGERQVITDSNYPKLKREVAFPDVVNNEAKTSQSPEKPPSNLPYELNRFIGRQQELKAICDLFEQKHSRLVTLKGPGGVGKTRLALRVAAQLLPRFQDGVWFVELEQLTNPVLITQLTVRTIGLVEEDGQTRMQTLIEYLRPRKVLLILDNCEHLIEDVAEFAHSLLRATPGLSILATSREPLDIEGEILWAIPPLTTPDIVEEISLDALDGYEAIDLFLERASSVEPGFHVNQQNALAICQICAYLDGIPLGIELAAARLRAFSVEDIVTRLDDRFSFLVGTRTSMPRQQTLKSLIDWSYELLPDKERKVMRRLSVFAGGWSIAAAEKVCSGRGVEEGQVFELLAQLVDKSLVVSEMQQGVIRYRFLETIRQYATNRLEEAGEDAEYADKHAQYFLRLARDSYGKCWGRDQGIWLDRLEREHFNLRKAMEHFQNYDPTGEALLRMAGCLWRYWEVRGYINMGRYWITLALEENPEASTYVRANGLRGAGILARQQSDYREAKEYHEESLALFRQLGSEYNLQIARQLDALGEIKQYNGNYEEAIELHKESLSLQEVIGDKEGVAASLAHLGVIARERGRYKDAEKLLTQSLQLNRQQGDRLRIGVDLNNLGFVATRQCHYEQALALHEEAVQQYRDLNNKLGISESLMNLGNVAKDRGDFLRAHVFYRECLDYKRELGDRRGIARTNVRIATTALLQGDYERARELADLSLSAFKDLGIKRGIVVALRIRAMVAVYDGDFERASKIAENCVQLAEEIEAPLEKALAKVVLGLSAHAEVRLIEAREWFEQALKFFRGVKDYRNIAHTQVGLARTAYRLNDLEGAQVYLNESLKLSRTYGIQWSLAYSLEIMGLLRRSAGDYDGALQAFQESLQLSRDQANKQGVINCLGAIAGVAAFLNQPEIATRLFAVTSQIRERINSKMGQADKIEYDKYVELARSQLDDLTFDALWSKGSTMSVEQAITLALSAVRKNESD